MIEFTISLLEFVLATFIPIFFGMFVIGGLGTTRVESRYLSAYALGLLFWFFLDTLNDAVQIGVNDGYNFSPEHTGLLLLFLVGFLVIAFPAGLRLSGMHKSLARERFFTALFVAIGMGFHGIGEGLDFGGLSAGTSTTTVLAAIGGLGGGVAYVLHKLLEASLVMIVYVGLVDSGSFSIRHEWKQVIFVGLAFGLPSTVGEVVGYFVTVDSSYLFALGGGAALAVALLAVRPIWGDGWKGDLTYSQYVKMSLLVLLGFLSLYAAAMFHS
jgi:hypothetical protein